MAKRRKSRTNVLGKIANCQHIDWHLLRERQLHFWFFSKITLTTADSCSVAVRGCFWRCKRTCSANAASSTSCRFCRRECSASSCGSTWNEIQFNQIEIVALLSVINFFDKLYKLMKFSIVWITWCQSGGSCWWQSDSSRSCTCWTKEKWYNEIQWRLITMSSAMNTYNWLGRHL